MAASAAVSCWDGLTRPAAIIDGTVGKAVRKRGPIRVIHVVIAPRSVRPMGWDTLFGRVDLDAYHFGRYDI
jgi:hypothetical protein